MKVAVALSGGVDSSTACVLLKEQGFDVFGITLNMTNNEANIKGIIDAKNVCELLKIEHKVLDVSDFFKKNIIENFAEIYLLGRTPSPCIKCNKLLKFGLMYEKAKELGADMIATGHYVIKKEENGEDKLFMAKDKTRDQSYFLSHLTKEQINKSIFPLGEFTKDEVREKAKEKNLLIASKSDSQDICFVPNGCHFNFIAEIFENCHKEGNIVDVKGKVLGKHKGISAFTIGQRRGLGIGGGSPLYVVDINAEKNEVVVGSNQDLAKKKIIISDFNWLLNEDIKENGVSVSAKFRSRQSPVKATVYKQAKDVAIVEVDEIFYGIAKGQGCALYQEERLVGGGWIDDSF